MGFPEKCSMMLPTNTAVNFLLECYQSSIECGELHADPHQKKIMLQLQRIYNNVLSPAPAGTVSHFSKLFSRTNTRQQPSLLQKGLYLWGGVGRGKTHLVDYFYKLLPDKQKLRLHFHRFMQLVHEELQTLDGVSDPLQKVSKNIADKARILCLDEMHVNDITDAMLLGKLFQHLFEQGVVLVTTSNYPPDQLYRNGLQRERFLPAISLLEQHTTVMEMGGQLDYRSKTLEENGLYHLSSGEFSEQRLEKYFHKLSGVELHQDRTEILINKRHIPVKMWADGVVWFDFDKICISPRSASDYAEIAAFFHTVIISDIPVMDSSMDDAARRFINMIDIFYDSHVNLVVSAAAEPQAIYLSDKLAFEFQRTSSRLKEMQSEEYITAEHMLARE